MKTLKLILSAFLLSAFAACASVTDANIDESDSSQVTAVDQNLNDEESSTGNDAIWFNSNGDDMDPIIDKPDSGGTYYD